MAERLGTQVGNYRLTRLIGQGGFAQVYLGEQIYLGRQAAVKLLKAPLASAGEVQRFRQEAQTIARLRHPHIVQVLDFGIDNEMPYLLLEYAPGGSLRDHHPIGTLVPLATVMSYVEQIAQALHYAHEQKIVHRDIKPQNLLVGSQGEILLTDFGISVVSESSSRQPSLAFAGTAAYSAPEQLQDHPRPASDQYALGVVVYEWLTGSLPFIGTNLEVISKQLYAVPPPLREKLPTISPAVEEVVLTALAKDPQQRFASVRAFATAFEHACQEATLLNAPTQHSPISTPPAPATAPLAAVPPEQHSSGSSLPPGRRDVPAPDPSAPATMTETPASTGPRRPSWRWKQPKKRLVGLIGLVAVVVVGGMGGIAWGFGILPLDSSCKGCTTRVPTATAQHPTPPATPLTATPLPACLSTTRPISIASVNFSGKPGGYTLTVNGAGFGSLPSHLPFSGDTAYFRIADAAQAGHGEWGYARDRNTLTYQVWSDQKIQVAGLRAAAGDAIALAVWNPASRLGATWGGNAPPVPSGWPQITSVGLVGCDQNLQITIHGSGFGPAPQAMPFTGDVNAFSFGDNRNDCGGKSELFGAGSGNWGVGGPSPVTLHFVSWSDATIQIAGFGGQYGQGCYSIQPGDPVTIQIWSSGDTSYTGPQTAWGGTIAG